MDRLPDEWWHISEQPFRSSKPVIGPLIVWVRNAWLNVATKWYVRALIQQQNEVNRKLALEPKRRREELAAVQEIVAAMDREMADLRRLQAQAIYGLYEERERLQARLDALEAEVHAQSVEGDRV